MANVPFHRERLRFLSGSTQAVTASTTTQVQELVGTADYITVKNSGSVPVFGELGTSASTYIDGFVVGNGTDSQVALPTSIPEVFTTPPSAFSVYWKGRIYPAKASETKTYYLLASYDSAVKTWDEVQDLDTDDSIFIYPFRSNYSDISGNGYDGTNTNMLMAPQGFVVPAGKSRKLPIVDKETRTRYTHAALATASSTAVSYISEYNEVG